MRPTLLTCFLVGQAVTAFESIQEFGSLELNEDCSGGDGGELKCAAAKSVLSGENTTTVGLQWKVESLDDCLDSVCIFVDREFGGGAVAVTTAVNADKMTEFPVMPQPDRDSWPGFTEAQVPGKGRGLVANRTIKRGEFIMVRTPVMTVQLGPPLKDVDEETKIPIYERAVEMLPSAAKTWFMAQYGDDVNMKIDKNCFRMVLHNEDDGGDHLGCFPEAARFNHDCRPNVLYRLNNITHTTVAARDIQAGEELTISYIDATIPREERQSRLHDWGFNCTCAQCRLPPLETAVSDGRLARIKSLERDLDNFEDVFVTADTGGELVDLYLRERLDIYLGHTYARAAINYALFGEAARAREYAEVAAEAVAREYGLQAGDVQPMRTLASDPTKHWSWMKRRTDDFED